MELVGAGLKAFVDKNGDVIPPFRQRFPWLGPDLQTLRNSFSKQNELQADDRLLAPIIGGEQFINVAVSYPNNANVVDKAILLIHGLGGSEDSFYKVATAHRFLNAGWTVYRMNYRGVGRSSKTSQPPYSGGLTDDLRSVLRTVAGHAQGKALYAMGFSLGGQLLLRTLGEGDVSSSLLGAVTVSAPLDLGRALAKLQRRRNGIYVRYLVDNMARDLGDIAAQRFKVLPEQLTSVWAFDEYVIAPAFGYKDAQDYYDKVSCLPLLGNISVPTLAIHSKDDPWIPWEDYHAASWSNEKAVGAVLLPGGGHVGFHCGASKGVWFENAALRFFNSI